MAGGVLYDSCTDQDFTYSANLPAGYGPYWNMDVELVGPDGNVTATSYLYGQSRTGTDSLFSATPRTWPGRTRFAGTVTFRLPMTRTLVQATPKRPTKGEVVRFAIKSQDERPAGYYGTSYADVKLHVKRNGSRRTFESTMTDESGMIVVKGPLLRPSRRGACCHG